MEAAVLFAQFRHAKFCFPEDAKAFNGTHAPDLSGRLREFARGALTNELLFLIVLCALMCMSRGTRESARVAIHYVEVFLFARVAHVLFFAAKRPLLRIGSAVVSTLATVGLAVQAMSRVLHLMETMP